MYAPSPTELYMPPIILLYGCMFSIRQHYVYMYVPFHTVVYMLALILLYVCMQPFSNMLYVYIFPHIAVCMCVSSPTAVCIFPLLQLYVCMLPLLLNYA